MKRSLLVLSALLALSVQAADVYVTSTTGTTSQSTTLSPNVPYSVQCDGPVYFGVGETGFAATSTNGVRVEANSLYDFDTTRDLVVAASLPVAGASTVCRYFKRTKLRAP